MGFDWQDALDAVNPVGAMNQQVFGFGQPQIRSGGGGNQFPSYSAEQLAAQRDADIKKGRELGREIFYDKEMTNLRDRQADLSKGYTGQELGALREQARGEVEGQRGSYLAQLAGRAGRAGIGGARAAAMQASADAGFQKNRAELERKLTADNANMVRQGNERLQDFILRQKYGELGTGIGVAQLGSQDRSSARQAEIAGRERDKGLLGRLAEPLGGLF